jgi:hypothetical protein
VSARPAASRVAAAVLVAALLAGCGPAAIPSATPGTAGLPTDRPAATTPAIPAATPGAPSPATPPGSAAPATPVPTPGRPAGPPPAYDPDAPPVPTPTPTPAPASGPAGRPTRVAVATLGIDLPVVPPPRGSTWPLCDVAEYFRPPTFQHPGTDGVTYIYAHAQEGMFLPILLASRRSGGRALVGDPVSVWTVNGHRYTYRISSVRRFQKSLDWAFRLPANSLVLQTSENQYRTGTKVMLVARQVSGPVATTYRESHPKARPRRCGP